jgi:hypothetical protein
MEGSTDHAAAGVDMAKLRQATPVKSKCKPTILGGSILMQYFGFHIHGAHLGGSLMS